MTRINPISGAETRMQHRNLTESQKKNAEATKEGMVVQTFIKDVSLNDVNMNDLYDSMVISDSARLPQKIYEYKTPNEKSIMPMSIIATGVMASVALMSILVKRNARLNFNIDPAKKLPSLTRNLAINEETHQAIYQMVQCPNQKTVMAGAGVFAISAMAFIGKMFMDGFKDVWVKKKEAGIQKDLQEKLISVETQSFSGKIQIIRSMLADKAREFDEYLTAKPESPVAFKKMMSNERVYFTSKKQEPKSENNLKYFALGAATLGAVVGLGFVAMKNIRSGKKYLDNYVNAAKETVSDIIKKSSTQSKDADKTNLKNILQSIDAEPKYIKDELSKLTWDQSEKAEFIEDVVFNNSKSTAVADKAMAGDGTPKPAFYSHVNDYRAFLYNWLLDTSNPLFKNLFMGITGVTAVAYGGKVMGEAVKDVQVKKINADTELGLQQKLVSTELRNFKAKKDTAINPLREEFYVQLKKGKPKTELKTIAENILVEVKNGPPFVYS
jgi:hypothetical protein